MAEAQNYREQRVLVTGAGGFIGSHLVEKLACECGAKVRAMLHYSSRADAGNLELIPEETRARLEIVRGDIRDPHFMLRAAESMDYIFHLAALIAIPHSYDAPSSYVQTNAMGTLNVLEAARAHRVKRVIHTSTSEVYGTAQTISISESHPQVGQSPYSATKIAADKLAESFQRSFELPVVTVRPFNTFGPRQSARAIVPTILSQLLAGRQRLKLGSLKPQRDLTFVADTVSGMLALGACDAAIGRAVNLGTGRTYTIGDIAVQCMAVVGREVEIEIDARRMRPQASEVMALVSDNRLARELCGWSPQVELTDGLRRCVAFMREHLDLYRPEEYQR